jgi:hypothetical protein
MFDFREYGSKLDPRITYTGASARMYFDSTGTLKYAPMNLAAYSQELDNAYWTKTRSTITQNATTAPDGTLTADKIVSDATAANTHDIRRQFTVSGSDFTASGYFKAAECTWVLLEIQNTAATSNRARAWFNLSTGAVGTGNTAGTGVTYVSHAIEDAGNGWYRCSLVATTALTGLQLFFQPTTGDNVTSWNGNSVDGGFAWGLMFQNGASLFDYIPTTTAAVYLPRSNAYQDHNPSTLAPLGFLIEEARTNSIRNNTMQGAVAGTPGTAPTNWSVDTTGGVFTRTIAGPSTEDGITYLDVRLQASGAGTFAIRFEGNTQIAASVGQAWTNSAYVKLAGGSLTNAACTIRIRENNAVGTILTEQSLAFTPTSAALRTQRALLSYTLTQALVAFVNPRIEVAFSGAGDLTLRIGLPQLELGAFATSPILTTAAAATRLADVASITGTAFSSFWNQTEGTIVAKFSVAADATSKAIVTVSDATANERLMINTNSALAGTSFRVVDGGVDQCDISRVAAYSAGQQLNVAVAYKVNDFAISFNGSAVGTDASGTIPTVTQMNIGGSFSGVPANVHIQSIADYSKRLPNSTLQTLAV